MRIAEINGCNICMAWRVPALAKHGVDEALYEHVEDPANGDYSEQELLAIEYADKFALDHRSLDDAFFDRMKAVVQRSRDLRAHGVHRRLGRVRAHDRGARPRRGVRVVAGVGRRLSRGSDYFLA